MENSEFYARCGNTTLSSSLNTLSHPPIYDKSFDSCDVPTDEGVISPTTLPPPFLSPAETTSNGEKLDAQVAWWKNVPFLYSGIVLNRLEWPTLTVEFLNTSSSSRTKHNAANTSGFFVQKLLMGTCTSGQETNYLMIGELRFPSTYLFKEDPLKCENYSGYIAPKFRAKQGCSPVPTIPYFEIKAKLVHLGDVNRALHMPQNEFLIATHALDGQILFFDYSKHPSYPTDPNICTPQLLLRGHTKEGEGLSWHTLDEGVLASCSADGKIAIWNVKAKGIKYKANTLHASDKFFKSSSPTGYSSKIDENVTTIEPNQSWFSHRSQSVPQNDIHFHPLYASILASCGEDGRLNIWDLRRSSQPNHPAISALQPEALPLNSFAFNLHSEYIVATGNDKGGINLWDLRSLEKSILALSFHTDAITRLHFNSANAGLLGSSSQDGTVAVWNISEWDTPAQNTLTGISDTPESTVGSGAASMTTNRQQTKPSNSLMFVHAAHKGGVSDFCWNSNKKHPLLAVSSGWDNRLCCWKMAETAFLDTLGA